MFDRSSIELRFVFDRTSLWYRLESKEVTKVKRKRSSHVPPMFLPSTSHFLILGKGREKGRKKEEKECWRGRREYYAFRDEYLASLIGHGITITELRIRLEAYTLSNRGRSQDTDNSKNNWLEASTKAYCSLLIAHYSLLVWYWLPASGEEYDHNP